MSKSKSTALGIKCLMICLSLYSFYRVNEVQRFEYSRPIRKGEKNPDNEFAVKKKKKKRGHLGGSVVEHLPLAQVMILGSWDQVPHQASRM